jgi:exopolyphosphatase/pppGpp-phosphohydrolase
MKAAASSKIRIPSWTRTNERRCRPELPGITPERTYQIVAGAEVAMRAMKAFKIKELEICPWALREGVLLERIDRMEAKPRSSGLDLAGLGEA